MHRSRIQTIAILSLLLCGSAAAYQETPETTASPAPTITDPRSQDPGNQEPNHTDTGKLSSSAFQPYYEKLKQDARSSQLSQASNERVVGGDTIMIAWSEKLDELRGFSAKVGDWEVLKIPSQKSIVPKVSTSVAVVELEGAIAGFSATKCCWDVIELPKDVRAETFVNTNMLTVQTPDHLYTFAAEKGQWTSPTDPELQPVSETIAVSDSDKMRNGGIYDQFQKWVENLPKHQAKGITLTGSAGVVRLEASRQSLMKVAKQKLAEWGYIGDGSNARPSTGDLAASLKSKSSKASPPAPAPAPASTSSVDELRVELENLEAKIVDQLRVGNESQDSKAKLAELRPQAEKAFDLRQQVLRLEAQRLQAKLKSIQESLQAREKNRDDLVSKRLKELGSAPTNEWSSSKGDEVSKGILEELQKAEIELAMQQQRLGPTHPKILNLQEKIAVLSRTLDKRAHPVAGSNPVTGRRDLQTPELRATTASSTIVQASGGYFEQATSIARTLRALRGDVLSIREDWLPHDNLIKKFSRPLADLIADGTVAKETTEADLHNLIARSTPMHESKGKELATAMKAWKQAWNSYEQQMKLLNLIVQKKQTELESLAKLKQDAESRFQAGAGPGSEVSEAKRQWNLAHSELLEATQVETIFRQIAVDEPELNPEHELK